MSTIKKINIEPTTDGRKRLVKVTFTPQVPDPANQFDVEVVFQVFLVDSGLFQNSYGVLCLSCTRMDTREHYTMSEEQRDGITEAALIAVGEEDAD